MGPQPRQLSTSEALLDPVRAGRAEEEWPLVQNNAFRLLVIRQASGEVTIVKINRKKIFGEKSIQRLGEELSRLVAGPPKAKILLNLGKVEYVTSAVLGKLMFFNRRVREGGGRLRLCGVQPNLRRMLYVTKLDQLLDIYDDEGAAFERF
jgi:anti-sigma B factor antagonist